MDGDTHCGSAPQSTDVPSGADRERGALAIPLKDTGTNVQRHRQYSSRVRTGTPALIKLEGEREMAMSDNQAAFSGWAKVEVMGHQSHVGFVTTEAYGQAVMFRIDRPGIPECEEELTVTQWVGDQYCRPGSIVKRDAVEPLSVLVGSGSIYRIIPCDEATALKAVRLETRRPLSLVKLVGAALLESGGTDDGAGDDGDEERGAEF